MKKRDLLKTALYLYMSALLRGFRIFCSGLYIDGIKSMVAPVGYWRFWPNAFVWNEALALSRPRILDVSSPKMLSLLLAKEIRADIVATDLDDEAIYSRWERAAQAIGLDNWSTNYADARCLPYPDAIFDLVYSISVIEHIPGHGDMEALAEICRVLKPNGVAVIEVPYRHESDDIYAMHDSKGRSVNDPVFYERYYDAERLDRRLKTEGLRLEKRIIMGEHLPVDRWIATSALPRWLRLAILPFEPWLAAFNYWLGSDADGARPLGALLTFRKF